VRLRNLTDDDVVLDNSDSRSAWLFIPHQIREIDELNIDPIHLSKQILKGKIEILKEQKTNRFELIDFE